MRFTSLSGCAVLVACFAPLAHAEDERSVCATHAEQAQEFRAAGKLADAREMLALCARPSCPAVVRQDCEQWLAEVAATVPSVVLQVRTANSQPLTSVSVWVDGQLLSTPLDGRPLALNPGYHHMRLESPGSLPIDADITLRAGEQNRRVPLSFEPMPRPTDPVAPSASGRSVLPYALLGIGAVAGGSFAYFGIKGRGEASDLADTCGVNKTCSEAQVDHVRTHLILADVSLGVSLVSLGVATWMLVANKPAATRESQPAFQVGLTPAGGVVKLAGAF